MTTAISPADLATVKDELQLIYALKDALDGLRIKVDTQESQTGQLAYLLVAKAALGLLDERIDKLWEVAAAMGLPLGARGDTPVDRIVALSEILDGQHRHQNLGS